MKNLFLLFVVFAVCWNFNWRADGFLYRNTPGRHEVDLRMALIPIGPFCPYRSSTATATEHSHDHHPSFAQEFSEIQSQLQKGKTPDSTRLLELADNMDLAITKWESLFETLGENPDFQSKEYANIAEAHLSEYGTSSESIALLIRWQSDCMRAMAEKEPPPMPPQELDLQKLMDNEAKQGSSNKPSISAMQQAHMVTATPFQDEAFESALEEYQQLVRDHSGLIAKGGNYENLDPNDKLTFLDLIELIEARWDALVDRWNPTINQEYENQCYKYLKCMKLDEDEFRRLVNVAHRRMRQDAERERDNRN